MVAKTEYDLVCESVTNHQVRLDKMRAKTGSYKRLAHIDESLLKLQKLTWDLESKKPVSGTPWTRPSDLEAVLAQAEEAESETGRWHSKIGWVWFIAFALGLLALAGAYLYLHWVNPELETETKDSLTTSRNVYFWKEVPLKFAEIAFWTGFGLLVFILYSLQHWVRQKNDVGVWGQWYFSKLLQGVFIGFVIALFFNEFKFTLAGLDVDFSAAPMPIFIILGFILGYYSDKARDYLDVIRDRFLAGTDMPQVEIETPSEDARVTADNVVVRGKVAGPQGMKGTLAIGKNDPIELKLDSSGNFARQVEVVKGINLIKVEGTSPNGKVGSKGISVTRVGPGLVLTLTSSLPNTPVHEGTFRLEGIVNDDTGTPLPASPVWILTDPKEPTNITTDVKGHFSLDLKLAPGKNFIRVLARRPEGNIATETVDVTYETSEKPG